jgi:hypothetical protein
MRVSFRITLILVMGSLLAGCAAERAALGPKHGRSLDKAGERVELRLLTFDQLMTYSVHAGWRTPKDEQRDELRWEFAREDDPESRSTYALRVLIGPTDERDGTKSVLSAIQSADPRAEEFEKRLREVFPQGKGQESAALLAALAPIAIDWLFDTVKSVVKEQSELYESQYSAVAYAGGFWQESILGESGDTPRYAGFELIRWTNQQPESGGEPAMRLVVAFIPSADDNRFFLLEPLFLQVQAARAKVARSKGKLSLRVNGTLEGSWVTEKFEHRKENVATIDWLVDNISLADTSPKYFFRSKQRPDLPYVAGWFLSPPLSYRSDGQGNPQRLAAGTPVRLAVVVTEHDKSGAKERLEQIPGVLDSVRPRVDEAVKSIVEEN